MFLLCFSCSSHLPLDQPYLEWSPKHPRFNRQSVRVARWKSTVSATRHSMKTWKPLQQTMLASQATAIYSNRPGNKIKTQATPMIISCFSWRTQLTLQRRVLIWHARVLMVWWSRPSRLACNILTVKIMLVCLKVEHDIPRTQANCEARSFEHTANSKSFGW